MLLLWACDVAGYNVLIYDDSHGYFIYKTTSNPQKYFRIVYIFHAFSLF